MEDDKGELKGPAGCPKIRWMDNVMKEIQAMKIVNWKSVHRIKINGSQLLSRPKEL
jgi:hypothetical protein